MDPQAPPDQKCEPRERRMGTASLQNRRIAQVLEVDQCGVYKQHARCGRNSSFAIVCICVGPTSEVGKTYIGAGMRPTKCDDIYVCARNLCPFAFVIFFNQCSTSAQPSGHHFPVRIVQGPTFFTQQIR